MDLKLKSIKEILNYNFFIPSYQRGYRWRSLQVEQLLDDIWTFAQTKNKDGFYPLQPVVVFKDNDKYELIDGQQRITTIYILFKYFEVVVNEIEKYKDEIKEISHIYANCFGNVEFLKIENKIVIEYETREESKKFLRNIETNEEDDIFDNPDFFYMKNAYNVIMEWFKTHNVNLEKFINTILNDVKIIWYEIKTNNEKTKRDIFKRLNIGKISLTNAELIRALLLKNISDYKEQIEFGNELDSMEYLLRDDLFFYFLTNKKRDSRIDLVFELLADSYKKLYLKDETRFDKNLDKNYSFYIFDEILTQNKKTEKEIFEDIKSYFRYLEEWFDDKKFYHKVGYLLIVNKAEKLLDFIEKYSKSNKQEFREFLDEGIRESLKNTRNIDDLKYGNKEVKKEVKKVLLLFNIQTILKNENISYKFDFNKYKAGTYDIEHIRSQTDKDIKGKDREEWIATLCKLHGKSEEEEIKKVIEKFKNDELFEKFYRKIAKKFDEDNNFDEDLKNDIGNLTLLDSGVNRSYKNSFFPVKRAIILEAERNGTFIPPCTRDVFLKVYSKSIKNMMSWDENDIKSHKEEIKETLKSYLGEENE